MCLPKRGKKAEWSGSLPSGEKLEPESPWSQDLGRGPQFAFLFWLWERYFPSAQLPEQRAGKGLRQCSCPYLPLSWEVLVLFWSWMGGRGSCDSLTQGSSVYPFEMVLVPHRSGPVFMLAFCDWFVSLQACPSRILCQKELFRAE